MANLYSRLQACFPEDRSKPFAHLADGSRFTYADLEASSARYAHAMLGLGVQVGDRVAVQVEKSLDMLMLYLGCVRAGAVFLPLNTAYTAGELDYFMRDAEPVLHLGTEILQQHVGICEQTVQNLPPRIGAQIDHQ